MSYKVIHEPSKTEFSFKTTMELLEFAINENNEQKINSGVNIGDSIKGDFYIEDEDKCYGEVIINEKYSKGFRAYTKEDEWEIFLDENLLQICD